MSKLEVDAIEPQSGTTLTIGASGDTVALGNGVNNQLNYPIFHVQKTSTQTVSDATETKVTYGTATIDTDSGWSDANDRWTVPSGKAGKYYITAILNGYSTTGLDSVGNYIKVNGTTVQTTYSDVGGGHDSFISLTCSIIKDLSVGDYVEHWGRVDGEPAGTYQFYSDAYILLSFSLFRIGD